MNKCELDERQVWVRGKIFKHSFILMMVLLLAKAFLNDYGIKLVEGMWAEIFIVVFVSGVCIIESVCRDAFDINCKRTSAVMIMLGVLAVALMGFGVYHAAVKGEPLAADGVLLENGAMLLYDLIWMSASVLYFVKKVKANSPKSIDKK